MTQLTAVRRAIDLIQQYLNLVKDNDGVIEVRWVGSDTFAVEAKQVISKLKDICHQLEKPTRRRRK